MKKILAILFFFFLQNTYSAEFNFDKLKVYCPCDANINLGENWTEILGIEKSPEGLPNIIGV